jgi:hypothetical protein
MSLTVVADGIAHSFSITCTNCDTDEDVRVHYHQEYVMITCHGCGATQHDVVDDLVQVAPDSDQVRIDTEHPFVPHQYSVG